MDSTNQKHFLSSCFPRPSRFKAVFASVLLLPLSLAAQQPDAAKQKMVQEKVAALKASVAQNQAALKQYGWTETTEISLKGEAKKREGKEGERGPGG